MSVENDILSDRQICLLSNSIIELRNLVDKMVELKASKEEILEVLSLLVQTTDTILTEVKYGIDITEVSNVEN